MSKSFSKTMYDLVKSRRSIRQFQPTPLAREDLLKVADDGRLAPSASNLQPLEFVVVDEPENLKQIFACLQWAAYIRPQGDPRPGQEPKAYVVVVVNKNIRSQGYERDVGAAMENMILVAWSMGIGSCWLVSVDRAKLAQIIKLPAGEYVIDSVLALGYPAESPIMEEKDDDIRYWQDDLGQLHVPKRKLPRILHWNEF